jgi:hypothetical protein
MTWAETPALFGLDDVPLKGLLSVKQSGSNAIERMAGNRRFSAIWRARIEVLVSTPSGHTSDPESEAGLIAIANLTTNQHCASRLGSAVNSAVDCLAGSSPADRQRLRRPFALAATACAAGTGRERRPTNKSEWG